MKDSILNYVMNSKNPLIEGLRRRVLPYLKQEPESVPKDPKNNEEQMTIEEYPITSQRMILENIGDLRPFIDNTIKEARRYVIGQDKAIEMMAGIFAEMQANLRSRHQGLLHYHKPTVLIYGKRGMGMNHLLNNLIYPHGTFNHSDDLTDVDITGLPAPFRAVQSIGFAAYHHRLTLGIKDLGHVLQSFMYDGISGVVLLRDLDKLVANEALTQRYQNELASFIRSKTKMVQFPNGINLDLPMDDIVFVMSGAFPKDGLRDSLETIVEDDLKSRNIKTKHPMQFLASRHLVEYGMTESLASIFTDFVPLRDLDKKDYKEILLKAEESPTVQARSQFFNTLKKRLAFKGDAIDYIAEMAADTRYNPDGARLLKNMIGRLTKPHFIEPLRSSLDGKSRLVITRKFAQQVLENKVSHTKSKKILSIR